MFVRRKRKTSLASFHAEMVCFMSCCRVQNTGLYWSGRICNGDRTAVRAVLLQSSQFCVHRRLPLVEEFNGALCQDYGREFWWRLPILVRLVAVGVFTSRHQFTYLLHGAGSFLRSYPGSQLVKKFPAFYETRKFITAFTSARHLSLS